MFSIIHERTTLAFRPPSINASIIAFRFVRGTNESTGTWDLTTLCHRVPGAVTVILRFLRFEGPCGTTVMGKRVAYVLITKKIRK